MLSISMVVASVSGMILGSSPELQSSPNTGITGKAEFKPHTILEYLELVSTIKFVNCY